MRIKPAGKIVIFLLVLGVIGGLWRGWKKYGGALAPSAATINAVIPGKADLPGRQETPASVGSTANVAMPGGEAGCTDKPEVRLLGYAWNAQMGLLFANGGPQATAGSLMCKNGVNLKFMRQDDNNKMQDALVAFATELKKGTANPGAGAHFVTIMGDGSATFLKGLNDTLAKGLGPEYTAKVVDACGYSHGEDKFMGPAEWKANPAASKGGVVAGVLRDGDWNIAQKWLGDNGLPTNPDEKTYDPDALNWVNASDYIDAATKYVTGYSEDRPVVHNGKPTGETRHIVVNAVVTWTPGDVTVAQKKGGLVSIVSTQEYSSQMPCVVIGIDKWMKANRSTVEAMIKAIADGGDAVKSSPAALSKAAAVSAKVYNESGTDAAYWEKYYKGTQETDKTGVTVALGGSSVNNLVDSQLAFGLVPGSANLFAATYKVFGDIVVAQYPNLVASIPPVERVVDTSYLQDVVRRAAPTAAVVKAAEPRYTPTAHAVTVSSKAWNIHFQSGRAVFMGDAAKDLRRLRGDLLVASGTSVEIHGHTDNQGDPAANMNLSEQRAFAVKSWLEKEAPVNFPKGRIKIFSHGQDNPVAPNSTAQGRAQNRRVEVILKSAG